MTRLDAYLGDRPIESIDLPGANATLTVDKTISDERGLEIRGFDGAQLVARYRTDIS